MSQIAGTKIDAVERENRRLKKDFDDVVGRYYSLLIQLGIPYEEIHVGELDGVHAQAVVRLDRLREAARMGLTELVYLAEQVKARDGGSVMRAIQTLKNAVSCQHCGGSGSITKSYGQGEHGDLYQEPCPYCEREKTSAYESIRSIDNHLAQGLGEPD